MSEQQIVEIPVKCPYCCEVWVLEETPIDNPWYVDLPGWPDVVFSSLCMAHQHLDFDDEESECDD